MTSADEGLLTIAYGPPQYTRMAKALARSYRRQNGGRPFAVVTDPRSAGELAQFFDRVIPVNLDYGHGVVQKLHADLYTPFERTLFVDSDCIFYRSPEELWQLYAIGHFCVRGRRYLTGSSEYEKNRPYKWVEDTSTFLRKNGITRFAHFNSGVFFFDGSAESKRVFEEARRIYERRVELGFVRFKNAPIADEPAFAAAMERCGIEMLSADVDHGMEMALGIERLNELNVLKGVADFYKGGRRRTPSLVHYNVHAQLSLMYNREVYRLAYGAGPAARLKVATLIGGHLLRNQTRSLGVVIRRAARRLGAAGT